MVSVKEREIWELAAKEKQEIVDLFDKGYPGSYIMRKANLSRYSIKQVLCAAGRTGMFRERDNSVDYCTHPQVNAKCRSDANQHLLDHLSSIETSQGAPGKESETVKTQDMYNITPDVIQEILDLFDQGHSCSHIIRRTNVSRYYIKQLLCAAGRNFRERNQMRYDALRPVVLDLFKQGWSHHAIKKHVKAKMFWVGKIIKDAGLMLKTRSPREKPPRVQPSPLKSAGVDKNVIVMIKKQDGVWRVSRGQKRKEPWIGSQLDWTAAEDVRNDTSSSGSEARSIMSIALDDLQWEDVFDPTKDVRLSQEDNSIAAAGSESDGHKQRENQAAGVAIAVEPPQIPPGQVNQVEKIIESSIVLPDICAETPSGILPSPEENATTSGRYQCQVCRLSWDDDEAFLLHLADTMHEQLHATGSFLYCTGCKFKSRKPAKVGRHVIKYQTQAASQNCELHSIKGLD